MKEDPGFLLAIKLELFVYIVLDSSQINIEIHCQSFAPYNISYFIRSNYILNWILFTSRAVSFMLINVRFDIPRKICCVMLIVHIAYCCRICILEKITVLLSNSKLMFISGEISLWYGFDNIFIIIIGLQKISMTSITKHGYVRYVVGSLQSSGRIFPLVLDFCKVISLASAKR